MGHIGNTVVRVNFGFLGVALVGIVGTGPSRSALRWCLANDALDPAAQMNSMDRLIAIFAGCATVMVCVLVMSMAACQATVSASQNSDLGTYLECRPDHDPDIAFRCWERDVRDQPR